MAARAPRLPHPDPGARDAPSGRHGMIAAFTHQVSGEPGPAQHESPARPRVAAWPRRRHPPSARRRRCTARGWGRRGAPQRPRAARGGPGAGRGRSAEQRAKGSACPGHRRVTPATGAPRAASGCPSSSGEGCPGRPARRQPRGARHARRQPSRRDEVLVRRLDGGVPAQRHDRAGQGRRARGLRRDRGLRPLRAVVARRSTRRRWAWTARRAWRPSRACGTARR